MKSNGFTWKNAFLDTVNPLFVCADYTICTKALIDCRKVYFYKVSLCYNVNVIFVSATLGNKYMYLRINNLFLNLF